MVITRVVILNTNLKESAIYLKLFLEFLKLLFGFTIHIKLEVPERNDIKKQAPAGCAVGAARHKSTILNPPI